MAQNMWISGDVSINTWDLSMNHDIKKKWDSTHFTKKNSFVLLGLITSTIGRMQPNGTQVYQKMARKKSL